MATLLTSPDKCFMFQRAVVLDEKEGQQVSCPPVFPSIQSCREAEQTPHSGLTSAPGWYTTPVKCFLVVRLAKDSNPGLLNCEIPKGGRDMGWTGSCGGAVERRFERERQPAVSLDVSFHPCRLAPRWSAGLGSDLLPLPFCDSGTLENGSTKSADPLRLRSCCLGVGHGVCRKEGRWNMLEASHSDETH